MSSKNNEANAAVAGFAFVGVAILATVAIIYAGLVLLSIIFSVLCFIALFKPLPIWGGHTITQDEALDFFFRGSLGAGATFAVVFVLMVGWDVRIRFDVVIGIILGGYAFGSVVIGLALEEERAKAAAAKVEVIPPTPARQLEPPHPSSPFRFAEWNDGDAQ